MDEESEELVRRQGQQTLTMRNHSIRDCTETLVRSVFHCRFYNTQWVNKLMSLFRGRYCRYLTSEAVLSGIAQKSCWALKAVTIADFSTSHVK